MKEYSDEKLNKTLKMAAIILAACLIVYLLADHVVPIVSNFFKFISPILLPFMLAFVFSIILEPLIGICERKLKMKRGLAVVLVLFIVFILVASILGAVISRLIVEVSSLATALSNLQFDVEKITAFVENIYSSFLINFADLESVKTGFTNFLTTISTVGVSFLEGFVNVLKSTPTTFVMLLVTLFSTYFFCKDKSMMKRLILSVTPKSKKARIDQIYEQTLVAFAGYFRAQLVVITVTTLWCMLGFKILDLDYVLLMGLLVGIFDILPVLGPGTLVIPWAIWNFVTGNAKIGIGLIVVYVVITVSRQFLEPKLVSQNIGLHPLATIAAIFIGMKLFGVVGLICGPIVLVVIMGIFKASKSEGEALQ